MEDLRQDEKDSQRTPEGKDDAKRRIILGVAEGLEKATAALQNMVKFHELEAWEREDPGFAEDLMNAFKLGTSQLVDKAYKRAMKDSDRLMEFLLEKRDPDRFGDKAREPLSAKPLADMTVAELEMYIGDLRAKVREKAMTIDGVAEVVDNPG